MSELGKVPSGLVKAVGSDLFWGVVRSEVRCDLGTGEVAIVLPLADGVMIFGLCRIDIDHGTGSVG